VSRRRLGLALAAVAALALGAAVWRTRVRRGFALPVALRVEQTVVDLTGLLEAGTVVAQRADAPVRIRGIRPGRNNNPNAGYRTALVAAAPSLLRWRTAVPETRPCASAPVSSRPTRRSSSPAPSSGSGRGGAANLRPPLGWPNRRLHHSA